MSTLKQNDKLYVPLIGSLAVAVPAIVAVLIFGDKMDFGVGDVSFLPAVNAAINSTVSILLVLGLVFIRRKQIQLHRFVMVAALVLSTLFLVSYVVYHSQAESVPYESAGIDRTIYLFILLSHILLSVVVVPLALLSVYRGMTNQIEKHRKITKWSWPIWLYVSVTGVVVYLMAHVFNPGLDV